MSKYCTLHRSIGGRFSDNTIITEIIIPPNCGERILPLVFGLVIKHGGKIWENPAIGGDGSLLLAPITFVSTEAQIKCCEEVEKSIETFIENQQPISIKPIENSEEQYELRLNMKFLFVEFHDIMNKISPVIEFIEKTGGWFNAETGQFSGFDALEKGRADGTLDKKVETAYFALGNFMGAYIIGSQMFNPEDVSVVPHK